MSDEKKAESLAESVNDIIISYIKKNSNEHEKEESKPIYYLLRVPLKSSEINFTSENIGLDVATAKPVENLDSFIKYKDALKDVIEQIGWKDNIEIESKCEISNAEAFTPEVDTYKVVGINKEHLPAEGKSAKFLDATAQNITNEDDGSDWKPSNWKLKVNFPSGNPTEEIHDFEVRVCPPWPAGDYDKWVTLEVKRNNRDDMKLRCKVKYTIAGIFEDYWSKEVDIQKEMDNCPMFPEIEEKTLQGLKNSMSSGNPNYNFTGYVGKIKDRINEVSQAFNLVSSVDISSDDIEQEPMTIEKGAILRISTTIRYSPSGTKKLEKTLVSEIPFKVSDVQSIAPEYSFFVANSTCLSSQTDLGPGANTLGERIRINDIDIPNGVEQDGRLPIGKFTIHNLPVNEDNKIAYDLVGGDNDRIPGMVRINMNYSGNIGDPVTEIRSFLGSKSEPWLTELNKFCSPLGENKNPFNTRFSFFWADNANDISNAKRFHEVELPVLFEDPKKETIHPYGIDGFIKLYQQGGFSIVSVPTLLFGNGHMEYPLGIRAEGPINSIFTRIRAGVKPYAKVRIGSVKDKTEVYYTYEPVSTYFKKPENTTPADYQGLGYPFDKSGMSDNTTHAVSTTYPPAHYGMYGYGSYNENAPWLSNTKYEYMPANCYDRLQYAKKATRYYETAQDFLADIDKEISKGGLKNSDGIITLSGVYYIKSGEGGGIEFTLPSFKYKGNGIIISKEADININGDITRADSNSTLGLIARTGRLNFHCKKIDAACFSNRAPFIYNTDGDHRLAINGNLVCNDFVRKQLLDVEVFYDNTITSVTPLASMRKVGKFEPKRYYVAFADNWSKFAYEKNKE